MAKAHKIGTPPDGRLGVYSAQGDLLGHVGHTATAVTVGRFTHRPDAYPGKKDGRAAWLTPNTKFNEQARRAGSPGAKATPGQIVASTKTN